MEKFFECISRCKGHTQNEIGWLESHKIEPNWCTKNQYDIQKYISSNIWKANRLLFVRIMLFDRIFETLDKSSCEEKDSDHEKKHKDEFYSYRKRVSKKVTKRISKK